MIDRPRRPLAALVAAFALALPAVALAQSSPDDQHPANPHPANPNPPPSGDNAGAGTTPAGASPTSGDDSTGGANGGSTGNTEPTGAATSSDGSQGTPGASSSSGDDEGGDEGGDEGDQASDQAAAATSAPESNETAVQPLTPEQQRLLVPAAGDFPLRDELASERTRRWFFPPVLHEWNRTRNTWVVFPLYFENHDANEHRFLIPPYYRIRTRNVEGDVLFPLYFRFHGHDADSHYASDVAPPFWFHTSAGPGRAHGLAYGVAPLFSYAESFNRAGWLDAEHLVIPPLLTYHRWWPEGQTTVVGPVMYFRDHRDTTWTAFPFVFRHTSPTETWTLVPPALTYIRTDHEANRTLSIVGLYASEVGPHSAAYNVAPVFFHYHDGNGARTTFVPFFHTESGPQRFSFFTVLGGYARDHNETTLVTPLYQNHRGANDLDAVLPFFFWSRTPRQGRNAVGLLPFFGYATSPTGYAWLALPGVGEFAEYGRYHTVVSPLFVNSNVSESHSNYTWVFPFFHAEQTPDHHAFNAYPLLYTAAGNGWHHNIFAPFVWDVGNREQRSQVTVVAPFFARVENRDSVTQWVFPNHVYWERRTGERGFGWDFFPFVQYGEPRAGDSYWSVLEGLVGHRRQGSFEQTQVFWIPLGSTRVQGSASTQQSQRARGNGDVLIEM